MSERSGEIDSFNHFMQEMALLEEQMQHVADTGKTLVRRFSPEAAK